jgi:CxxC-x17-CxxC domain-containing protein
MHKVTCGDCGNECQIPFKPKYDRPVYCKECFKNHKPQKRSDSEFSRYDRDRTPINSRDNFRKHEYQKKTIDYNSNLSPKLFDILDKKECVICGFDDERALGFGQIDDKESLNFVQRENIPSSWEKYVSEPELAKEKIQILCLNCNQLKQEEFND